jgi:hypothetical protein
VRRVGWRYLERRVLAALSDDPRPKPPKLLTDVVVVAQLSHRGTSRLVRAYELEIATPSADTPCHGIASLREAVAEVHP